MSRLQHALLVGCLCGPIALPALPDVNGTQGPAAAVMSFNQAITNRKIDQLADHFMGGGVQFTLRPSHKGLAPQGVTSALHQHWATVAPVLFAATSSYVRRAEILDSRVEGEIATVWARISTETVLAGSTEKSSESFTEVYLLLDTPSGWKIVGIADNRPADDIGLAASDES